MRGHDATLGQLFGLADVSQQTGESIGSGHIVWGDFNGLQVSGESVEIVEDHVADVEVL